MNFDRPPNGTIFEALNAHGIPWHNYYNDNPSSLIWTYLVSEPAVTSKLVHIGQFFTDAAAGTLPAFSLVDPNFGTSSEENPQDVQFGDQFLSQVVNAVMTSPQWQSTLLVWTYDEGGGYYDHVPPPCAPRPDLVPPKLASHRPTRAPSAATASGCPPGWCHPSPGPTTCPTWCTTTPPS